MARSFNPLKVGDDIGSAGFFSSSPFSSSDFFSSVLTGSGDACCFAAASCRAFSTVDFSRALSSCANAEAGRMIKKETKTK